MRWALLLLVCLALGGCRTYYPPSVSVGYSAPAKSQRGLDPLYRVVPTFDVNLTWSPR